MSTNKNNGQPAMEEFHAFLEKTLIETYLKGKGYKLEELGRLPEAEAKRLMREASTYASCRLAELEGRAHFIHELHDAYNKE